jgi:hypothetical protein
MQGIQASNRTNNVGRWCAEQVVCIYYCVANGGYRIILEYSSADASVPSPVANALDKVPNQTQLKSRVPELSTKDFYVGSCGISPSVFTDQLGEVFDGKHYP